MLTASEKILIRLLAFRDAHFNPLRNIVLWRSIYRARGIPWSSEGGTAARRKQQQRSLEELIEAGYVLPTKSGTKTTHVKLTDQGEVLASQLAALPSIGTFADGEPGWMWGVFEALKRRAPFSVWIDHLVPAYRKALRYEEHEPLERKQAVWGVVRVMTPLFARGWVHGGPSVRLSVRYAMTEEGMKHAGPVAAMTPDVDEAITDLGAALYDREWDIGNNSPVEELPGEIGHIPFAESACSEEELQAWHRSAELATQGL